jgi:predicted nucleotidyltransferase component of viral defense system
MISRKELEEYARMRGLNLGQAEKDYLQTIMLFILYQKYGKELIFKGGTALNQCFNLDRFSQDIDFTSTVTDEFGKVITKGLKRFLIDATAEEKRDDSIKIRFEIKGPLYTGDKRTTCFIVVDISLREKVILQPLIKRIGWNHPELPVFDVVVMQEAEILAEKVRAVLTRTRARDVYDIFFLIQKSIKPSLDLINKKLAYYGLTFHHQTFIKKLNEIKKVWKSELSPLVKVVPQCNEVVERISSKFSTLK